MGLAGGSLTPDRDADQGPRESHVVWHRLRVDTGVALVGHVTEGLYPLGCILDLHHQTLVPERKARSIEGLRNPRHHAILLVPLPATFVALYLLALVDVALDDAEVFAGSHRVAPPAKGDIELGGQRGVFERDRPDRGHGQRHLDVYRVGCGTRAGGAAVAVGRCVVGSVVSEMILAC